MTKGRLVLLRHGTTTAGPHGFLGSRADPSLDAAGRIQAELLAQRLQKCRIVGAVVSPMRRARETADLAVPWLSVRIDERVQEIDYGMFSGSTVVEVEGRYPRELQAWR